MQEEGRKQGWAVAHHQAAVLGEAELPVQRAAPGGSASQGPGQAGDPLLQQ